jgi:hypothetical protein
MGLFSILKDKAGQGPDHSELAELNDLSVASRAKSEFAPKRQAHFTEAPIYRYLSTLSTQHTLLETCQQRAFADLHRPANDSPKIAALYKAGPSKSFTANTTALSHLHLAAESSDSTIGAQITPEDVEYTSNAQFQNRVELYRGRCVSSSCAEEMPSVMYMSITLAALSSCNSRHMTPCPSPANCASLQSFIAVWSCLQ